MTENLLILPRLPNACACQDLEDFDKRFSDDILKIELSGPEHHRLSVVDVPGLFHSESTDHSMECY